MEILGVVVAVIAAMGVGAVWYSLLFHKQYVALAGFSEADVKKAQEKGMTHLYIYNFLAIIVTTVVLMILMEMTGLVTVGGAIGLAVILWIGFIAPISVQNVLWDKTPFKLYLLTTAQNLVALVAMGIVLALFM